VASEPELLAHHHTRAGAFNDAIEYWRRAAERAIERSASRDAVEHLTRGLETLARLPDDARRVELEAALQVRLGAAYNAAKGQAAPEVETAYLRARSLCQASGNEHQLFVVLRGLWLCYQVGSKLDAAHRIGEDLLEIAQSQENTVYLVEAHRALGQTALWSGRFAESWDYFGRGLALYDPQAHGQNAYRFGQDPRVISSCMAATARWILGYPDQARRGMRQSLDWAEELNHPYSRSVAGIVSTFFYTLLGDLMETRSAAERTIQVATKYEFPFFLAFGTVYQGRTKVIQGFIDEGLEEMRRGFDLFSIKTEAWWYFSLVDICMDAGLFDRSQEALTVAFKAVERSNDRLVEAELYRLKGELVRRDEASAQGDRQAEALFRESLAVARAQEAKSWELRATTSLARLWRDQGKRVEAHDLLAPVYDWFTEGFDTPDLKDAKALLDELA
jgi:tetratricopeptide (TPR) repeat protein